MSHYFDDFELEYQLKALDLDNVNAEKVTKNIQSVLIYELCKNW